MSKGTVESVESGKQSGKQSEECEKQRKFPTAVPFILVNVFFERFCSGGILGKLRKVLFIFVKFKQMSFSSKAILAIFLNQKLGFNSDESTAIFHANEFLLYFFTIIGAIIADSWLGLFKTISMMTLLFSIGAGTVAIATIDSLELPIK
jgi:dipeptide/tripeptide permease